MNEQETALISQRINDDIISCLVGKYNKCQHSNCLWKIESNSSYRNSGFSSVNILTPDKKPIVNFEVASSFRLLNIANDGYKHCFDVHCLSSITTTDYILRQDKVAITEALNKIVEEYIDHVYNISKIALFGEYVITDNEEISFVGFHNFDAYVAKANHNVNLVYGELKPIIPHLYQMFMESCAFANVIYS